MGQSRTLPPRMQNIYQRSHSWNGGGQPWQRPSSSSSPATPGERPQHHYQHHRERGDRSERVERTGGGGGGAPAVHVLPPRMRAVKAPRHQSNTAIDPSFGLVAPPSPPSPSDPLGLGRNLDQLNAARPSIARSYNNEGVNSPSYTPLLNFPTQPTSVLYATGMDNQRTSQLSPDAPVFQPRFGMPASSAPLYHHSSNVDEFPFPFVGGGGGSASSSNASYQGGDVVGNIGDMTMNDPTLGVSFPILMSPSSSPSTSPTRTSPTGSPPKMTRLPPIAPPPATKPDDNTPPPPAYLVNFLASKFGPTSPNPAPPSAVVATTPVQEQPAMVLYDSALSSAATITLPVSTMVVPGVTPKMVPSSSSTMSLVPTVPILKLPTPPNKRPSSSPSPTPRPAPSPLVSSSTTTPKTIVEVAPRRPSAPSRSSYIVADMLLNRIRSSPLRPGLGPRRATAPALSGSGGSTSPISRSCLSKEVMMDDVVMLSLPVSS